MKNQRYTVSWWMFHEYPVWWLYFCTFTIAYGADVVGPKLLIAALLGAAACILFAPIWAETRFELGYSVIMGLFVGWFTRAVPVTPPMSHAQFVSFFLLCFGLLCFIFVAYVLYIILIYRIYVKKRK